MDLGLGDRVAVVTAASKGLGRGSVRALAAEGARVVINARDKSALDALAATLPDAVVVPGDISEAGLPAQLIDAAISRWGRIDIVVGNAGGPPMGGTLDVDDEQILAAVNANMLASIRLARAALPHMRQQQWGRICFIPSATVRQPDRDLALSNIARTGLWAWAKTAAQDVAAAGITVNLIAPGEHATDRQLGIAGSERSGNSEDFGKVVAFLCSEPANLLMVLRWALTAARWSVCSEGRLLR
jgi:3-oxoacyl-[acyl-carrier protein] reductase